MFGHMSQNTQEGSVVTGSLGNVKKAFASAGTITLLTGFMLTTPILCFSAPSEWVQWDVSSGGNGHWYKPVPGFPGLTWTLANELAQAEGGYLATITSAEENAFVFSLVANDPQYWNFCCNYSGAALGGLQQEGAPEPAGGWYWVTGESWTYSNWYPGQPNNRPEASIPEERLHFFYPDGQWNDLGKLDFNLGGYVIERDTNLDHDSDGIADNQDECPDSDLSATVVIDGCDSGVPNTVFPSGCTIPDLIATCAERASNHGQFVSCVSHWTNDLKKAGTITGQQKGAIQSCSAQANTR
jgi:hypothetical protein